MLKYILLISFIVLSSCSSEPKVDMPTVSPETVEQYVEANPAQQDSDNLSF